MKGRIINATPGIKKTGLPRVGFIKVGMLNDNGYPQSVDHFIATGKYAAMFHKAYGPKPQQIQIVFPDDDPEKVCNEMYEYRDDAGRRVAYGDGETFMVWDGNQYREYNVSEYPGLMAGVARKHPNRRVKKGEDGWTITLILTFIIPMVRGVAGVWQFITKGSASTIPNIRETFDITLQERGFVRGIIFDMNVQFATSQKPGVNSRFPVVDIVPNQCQENLEKINEALKPIKLLK